MSALYVYDRKSDAAGEWQVTVLAEEPRAPYDRVGFTTALSQEWDRISVVTGVL